MNDDELKQIYTKNKTIAFVGLSTDSGRPSFQVATYFKEHGYTLIPVNPKYSVVIGEKCYPDLVTASRSVAPAKIDTAMLFRKSEQVLPHIEEAIKVGVKTIWMPEGVEHHDGAAKAKQAGVTVVMNVCGMKQHRRLFTEQKLNF